MCNSARFLGAVVSIGVAFAGLSAALADPLGLDSTSAEPILPDLLPYTGPAFPAASATAGTADPGPALERLHENSRTCSALNPCAMPSPALMNVPAPQPAQGKENARKAVAHTDMISERR